MELLNAIRVAHALAGNRPAAFICGRPPRIVVSVLWPSDMTAQAMQLWSEHPRRAIRETAELTGFARTAANHHGEGLLVVAAVDLAPAQRRSLAHLTAILDQLGGTTVADLLNRLEREVSDPGLRRDFDRFLRGFGFNIQRAAKLLGVSRPTLYKRIRKLGISIDRLPAGLSADRENTP